MLKEIKVGGFKSFENTTFRINPGINAVIGPNGSGKTNFLALLEFLSNLARYPLQEAASRSGGAGELFRRVPDKDQTVISNCIDIELSGKGTLDTRYIYGVYQYHTNRRTRNIHVEYTWRARIELIEKGTSLVYREQYLGVSVFNDPQSTTLQNKQSGGKRWHFIVSSAFDGRSFDNPKIIDKLNRKAIAAVDVPPPAIRARNYLQNDQASQRALFDMTDQFFSPSRKVTSDLVSGNTFNLDPSKIKQPEDIARVASISADGSGLAASLYRIQENRPRNFPAFERARYRHIDQLDMDEIKELFGIVNENIIDIEVENNALQNILIPLAHCQSNNNNTIKIPFSMLSDGTVKWFALALAVLSDQPILSIEEPENFLHPNVQKEFVSLVRSRISDKPEEFFIFTSHSETFINQCNPSELAIFYMKDGVTHVKYDIDADLIEREINETGFGLGYYYLSGALFQ